MEAREPERTAASLTRDALNGSRYGVFRQAADGGRYVVLHDYQTGRDLKRTDLFKWASRESTRAAVLHLRSLRDTLVRGGANAERVRRELAG